MNIVITPTYKDIYGEPTNTIEYYLNTVNRKRLIEVCLFFVYSDDIKKDLYNFCYLFFSNHNTAKQFIAKMNTFCKHDSVEYKTLVSPIPSSPVNIHSALELLRICFSLPLNDKEDTLINEEIENNILKAVLLINGEITLNSDDRKDPSDNLFSSYNSMMISLPYSDFTNIVESERFINSIVKAEMFFEFCSLNEKYNLLLEKFLEKYSFDIWMDYLYVLSKLFIIRVEDKQIFTRITLNSIDEDYSSIKTILGNLSISWDEIVDLKNNIDYKYFREKPIVRMSEDEFIVINKSICADRIYNSIIFEFNLISKDKSIDKSLRINDLFSDYRENFSEKLMFYNIIQDMYANLKCISLSGEECRQINNYGGEPDYYVRNWNDIFLYEFKDVLIQGDIKTSGSYEEVRYMIEDKFVHKKKNDNPSAIEQIALNVERILSNTFVWDSKYKSSKVKIYPILVIGDSKFDVPGFSYILNDYFQQELKNKGIQNSKVGSLLVVNIDVLLNYRYDFQDRIIKLDKICDEYYKYLKSRQPYKLTQDNIIKNAFHYMFSLSDFMKERYRIKSNKSNLIPFITRIQQYQVEKL